MPGTSFNKGFTLIELLLAMAISAFVALIGYQGLRVAIDTSARVEEESLRLADIELALGIIESDIGQIIARAVRTELGTLDPVLSGGLTNDSLLLFSREGWSNPRQLRRSELARINYQWRDNTLVRQRWLVLDRVIFEEGLEEAVLLEGVEDFRVEFFTPFVSTDADVIENSANLNGQWVDWWNSERIGLDYEEPLPPVVRITMIVTGFGQLSRIISIASA